MNLVKTGGMIARVIGKNAPILISAAAGIGLIALYILTIKETEEAQEVLNEMPEEETQGFKTAGKIVKIYAPSFICLIVTLFCIVSSALISHHRIRDLTAYAAGLSAAFNQYRQQIIFQNGKEMDQKVMAKVARARVEEDPPKDKDDDSVLCLLPGYDCFFHVPSTANVSEAFLELNKKIKDGYRVIEFPEFMKLAKAKEPVKPKFLCYGWETFYLEDNYQTDAFYPNIFKETDDDGLEYYVIDNVPMPRLLEERIFF